MKLHVSHTVTYRYTSSVTLAPQHILMHPRENHHLSVLRYRLQTRPEMKLYWARNHHENSLAIGHHYDPVETFEVHADFEVETLERNPFDFLLRLDGARYPFTYTPSELALLAPYLERPDGPTRALLAWTRSTLENVPDDTLELLTRLNTVIRERFTYAERTESGVQTPEETIQKRSGTCRDFAVLLVHACQALGIAARFVSGYLYDPSAGPGKPRGSLHAWTEIHLPGAGWKGFDPTHAILADEHFIPVAVGRTPQNLNPVTGAYWGGREATATMEARVEIRET